MSSPFVNRKQSASERRLKYWIVLCATGNSACAYRARDYNWSTIRRHGWTSY